MKTEHGTYAAASLPASASDSPTTHRTNFERAAGQLIKPDSFSVDIGLFTVEKAHEATKDYRGRYGLRIGEVPFAKKSVKELAAQGSYCHPGERGVLGKLVGRGRNPPLSPEAAEAMLRTKMCTNGSDTQLCIDIYRKAATKQLGSTPELSYDKLEWSEAEFERLGEALCYCGALETLALRNMQGLSDTAVAGVVASLASCTSLRALNLSRCRSLTVLPDLSSLKSLQTLRLFSCYSLTALPDLSALKSLQMIDLRDCSSLTALPDLSALTDLEVDGLPIH